MDAPIGIFDSGVGGLTVARAVLDQLPHEPVVYVGDTAHGPYGPRPIAEVRAGRGVLEFTASDAYAEIPDALTVLRVLAALGLIPAELAQQRQRCDICGEDCREVARWEHVKPLMVWREHGPHPAEVAE